MPKRKQRRTYSPEFRAAVLADVRRPDMSVPEVAKKHKVAESIVYSWRRTMLDNSETNGSSNGATAIVSPDQLPLDSIEALGSGVVADLQRKVQQLEADKAALKATLAMFMRDNG